MTGIGEFNTDLLAVFGIDAGAVARYALLGDGLDLRLVVTYPIEPRDLDDAAMSRVVEYRITAEAVDEHVEPDTRDWVETNGYIHNDLIGITDSVEVRLIRPDT